ncbi:MAG: PAS domain-containing protein [Candidatus Saccharibacteria bacterium]
MSGENVYLEILNALEEGVYFLDSNHIITYWNQAAEKITGYKASEVIGGSCADTVLAHVNADGVCLCGKMCPASISILDGKYRQDEVYLHHKHGHRVPVSVKFFPMRGAAGNIIGVFEVFSDLSIARIEKDKLQEYIKHSFIDEETMLFNKRYFNLKMPGLLAEAKQTGGQLGLITLSINNLNDIEEKFGMSLARQFVHMTINTSRSAVNSTNQIMFTWGHNRYLFVIPNVSKATSQRYADNINTLTREAFLFSEDQKIAPLTKIRNKVVIPEMAMSQIIQEIDSLFD